VAEPRDLRDALRRLRGRPRVPAEAKAELPLRPGLSRGTALYYLGLTLDKLGYRPQAVEAYRAAAELKEATLIDNDGPPVSTLASRRAAP
jgi:hypothetical protein